jgi:thiosulfate dehydrogenase [quinone] large subunit
MERQAWAAMTRGDPSRDPALLRNVLGNVRVAPLWLVPRVVLGWFSLQAGWGLLRGLPARAGQAAGNGYDGNQFLAIGLTLAGIALILGLLTGPAAFVAGCLSAGLWAGEGAAVAAMHFALVVLLVVTWKTAGWIGLDRWVLPLLGWTRNGGALFGGGAKDRRR